VLVYLGAWKALSRNVRLRGFSKVRLHDSAKPHSHSAVEPEAPPRDASDMATAFRSMTRLTAPLTGK
jgi:hypothetical protein